MELSNLMANECVSSSLFINLQVRVFSDVINLQKFSDVTNNRDVKFIKIVTSDDNLLGCVSVSRDAMPNFIKMFLY